MVKLAVLSVLKEAGAALINMPNVNENYAELRFYGFGITDYLGHQFTAHSSATQAGEPREAKHIEACRLLGRRLAEWVAVFVDGRKEMHPLNDHYKRNPGINICPVVV